MGIIAVAVLLKGPSRGRGLPNTGPAPGPGGRGSVLGAGRSPPLLSVAMLGPLVGLLCAVPCPGAGRWAGAMYQGGYGRVYGDRYTQGQVRQWHGLPLYGVKWKRTGWRTGGMGVRASVR